MAFTQTGGMDKVTAALNELLNAASVNAMTKVQITALVQANTGDEDLQPGGAPDPAAYKSKSGGIVATLEDMLEKAKAEHADGQKAEMNAKFDFDMLKQKLEDAVAVGNKERGDADDSKKLQDLQQECMTKATDYETSQHSRS